jgi:hypothetical protein
VDPGPFFYIVITVYHLLTLFTFLQTTIFYHSIRLILCLQKTGEIDNLTVSWGKVLGCVVCRFYITAGAKLRPRRGAIYKLSGAVTKLASINLRKLVLSPTGLINLGFILREYLLLYSSYLPLGFPTGRTSTRHQAIFLALLSGRKRISARGVSRFQSFTLLLFCFILFLLASFYQKYKKCSSFIVAIFTCLLLVLLE